MLNYESCKEGLVVERLFHFSRPVKKNESPCHSRYGTLKNRFTAVSAKHWSKEQGMVGSNLVPYLKESSKFF